MITSKTFLKRINERGGRGVRFDPDAQRQAQERRAARLQYLRSTVDARVKP